MNELPQKIADMLTHKQQIKHQVFPIPSAFQGQLKQHQVQAYNFAMQRDKSMLALDLGLGKTCISIAVSLNTRKNLVVCPAALKMNWVSEFNKFSSVDAKVLHSAKDVQQADLDTTCIVSYSLLHTMQDVAFDLIVCDEAHYLKNMSSKRSKAMNKMKCHKLLLLTATPVERHCDLYNLLRLMDKNTFSDFHHYTPSRINRPSSKFYFGERYCVPKIVYASKGRQQLVFTQNRRAEELSEVIKPFVLTMRITDVVSMPELSLQTVVVGTLSKQAKKMFDDMMNKVADAIESSGKMYADAKLMELLRVIMRSKINAVNQYVSHLLETHDKFIVFAFHKEMQQSISDMLAKKKVKHVLVNGDVPVADRTPLFDTFEHDPQCRVGVFSLSCCSTGLNFAFCQLTSILMKQAAGRTYRLNQQKKCVHQYLVLQESTDDMVFASLQRKTSTENMVLEGKKHKLETEKLTFARSDVELKKRKTSFIHEKLK
jgi:SNF2 family DNA or RNA helicase